MNIVVRPYKPGEEKYISDAHRRIYSEEYNWGESFISYAVKIPLEFARNAHSQRECMWVAEDEGRPIGSIMLCETDDPAVGQLRLFLVEKEYRGRRIGSALVGELMKKAREAGYSELVLETASSLTTAIGNYKKLGFVETERTLNTDWSTVGETLYEIKMKMKL